MRQNGATAVMDKDVWEGVAYTATGGFTLGGGFAVLRWFINWITGRHDRREAQIDQKDAALDERWAKYTKKLEERVDALEEARDDWEKERAALIEDVQECHRSKIEIERRVAILEGFDQGMGDRRQADQVAQSWGAKIERDSKKDVKP